MIFKCKNCGGNTVYSPEQHRMYCPFCQSLDSEEKIPGQEPTTFQCSNCGGELQVRDYLSASRCPFCEDYIVFDEWVSGQYEPKLMIPFMIGKNRVKELIRTKFKFCIFAPDDFYSDARLDSMTGMYVPFWMFDFHAKGRFEGTGRKIRTWVSENREYTETKVYHIVRDMEVNFDKIPVDASYLMPDQTMDLMEPYRYNQMEDFKEAYLSGFSAEYYNMDASQAQPRAEKKAQTDTEDLIRQSIAGYTGVTNAQGNSVRLEKTSDAYALLPVWIYNYSYKNASYLFYVNGQTGKIVGKVPVSKGKVLGYSATVFLSLSAILMLISGILQML